MTTQTTSQPLVPLDNDSAVGASEPTDAKSQALVLGACILSLAFYLLRSDAVRDFIQEVTRLVNKL